MRKFIFSVSLVLSSLTFAATPDWQNFAKLPIVEQPQISPDGSKIAMLYNTEQGPAVALTQFPTLDFNVVARLKKNRDRVDFIRWSGNKYLIIGASYPEWYNGQHFRVERLYSVNVANGAARMLTTRKFEKSRGYQFQSFNLVSALRNDEDHALIATYDEKDRAYAVYKVELGDADFEKVQGNHQEIDAWIADRQGVVRLGIATEKSKDTFLKHIWYRAKPDDDLQKIHTAQIGKDNTFNIVGLTNDGDKAYILSDRQTGYESLWLYDIPSGKFENLVFSQPGYDLSDSIENSQGELIGVEYFDDYYRTHYFDAEDGEVEASLAKLLKGKEVTIASQSKDKNRLLVYAASDHQVPTYFWFDLTQNKGGVWISQFPYLAKKSFSQVENISFKASDGLEIPGYLTMPEGVEKPKLVVMPHGGPHARDYKYFDPFVQYLTSMGYAVLQTNFRGSSGFGSAFETAGYYEYGKRMQQDVYEAMDWLISTGRVSEDKACAVGASYGGYWALTAAFQQPERFDCIVSVSGISDLQDMVEDRERWDYYSGNIVNDDNEDTLEADIKALEDVSAINHVNKIKAPILLIHGTKDTRVPHQQSADFYSKAKGSLDVEYIEIKDGTHFFDDAESEQTRYKAIGEFLSKHL